MPFGMRQGLSSGVVMGERSVRRIDRPIVQTSDVADLDEAAAMSASSVGLGMGQPGRIGDFRRAVKASTVGMTCLGMAPVDDCGVWGGWRRSSTAHSVTDGSSGCGRASRRGRESVVVRAWKRCGVARQTQSICARSDRPFQFKPQKVHL
jgi:hypothetical protein